MRRSVWPAALLAVAAWGSGPTLAGGSLHPSAASTDQILLPANLKSSAVVLVRGQRRSGACLDGEVFEGSTAISVEDLVNPTTCPSEVAVFSREQAMTLQHPSWSAAADRIQLDSGPPPLTVDLNVYVAVNDAKAARRTRADITRAVRLYRENRVGITFRVDHFDSSPSAADRLAIGSGCRDVGALKRAGPPLFDPTRINVYVVQNVIAMKHGEEDDTWRGYNCFKEGGENVIYVSVQWHSPTTLAHELGHALGLRPPCGHTGYEGDTTIAGFTAVNIMWSGLSDTAGAAQSRFSLGQAYRMNASPKSWVNHVRGTGATGRAIRTGETRSCPTVPPIETDRCPPATPARNDPCPPLALDTKNVR
jgi:hypothetical protein